MGRVEGWAKLVGRQKNEQNPLQGPHSRQPFYGIYGIRQLIYCTPTCNHFITCHSLSNFPVATNNTTSGDILSENGDTLKFVDPGLVRAGSFDDPSLCKTLCGWVLGLEVKVV